VGCAVCEQWMWTVSESQGLWTMGHTQTQSCACGCTRTSQKRACKCTQTRSTGHPVTVESLVPVWSPHGGCARARACQMTRSRGPTGSSSERLHSLARVRVGVDARGGGCPCAHLVEEDILAICTVDSKFFKDPIRSSFICYVSTTTPSAAVRQ
jgi:hypothetical protein